MLFSKTVASSAVLALANASALSSRSLTGEATFYGGNVGGGACSFSTYTLPSSLFGTALSDSNWDTSANCGACVKVTGPAGNTITAMIVDECPGCGTNHLDLFPTAFSTLSAPSVGIIPISWDYVECGITSPLEVISKSGVSAYWFSMQVVNSNKRVTSLEVSTDGGSTWQATVRKDYNFFENQSGFGTTTVSVKITSIDGEVITIKDVTVSSGVSATASSNFGSGSSVAAVAKVEAPSSSAEAVAEAVATTATEAAAAATPAIEGAVFVESSSAAEDIPTSSAIKSTVYRTTSILRTTTRSATTTSTSTITLYPSSSVSSSSLASNTTVTIKATKYVEPAVPTNTYPISVITISTCIPTVVYSVVTIVPTATPSTSVYVSNATVPVATSTPSTPAFTGSAASLQGCSSIVLAAFAGLAALLFV